MQVHNAFSDRSIAALDATLEQLAAAPGLRGLIVRGEGRSFCAGADLEWMRRAAHYTAEQSEADALALSRMLQRLATLPCLTLALVHGAALGGGVGLVAACDVAVAARTAKFALSEARLGLIPATISPYVLRRIGAAQASRYFLTAERFDADRARELGLVHEVADDAEGLERWAAELKTATLQCAPSAVAAGKRLIERVAGRPVDEALLKETAQMLSAQRTSEEGREGISAFLEKRPPAWNS